MGSSPFGLLQQLPDHEEDREDADHRVAEEECWNVPEPREEDGIAADERHDEGRRECVVCCEGRPPGLVHKGVAVETLYFACLFPLEERECHDGEIDKLRSSNL